MRNSYYHFTKSQCTFSLILIRRLAARRGAGAGLPAHGRSRRMLATARRKPHVHSMWKRLAGRPTAGAGPSPPTSTRCKVPSFCIGRAFLPWIIRTRYGPQPVGRGGQNRGWANPDSGLIVLAHRLCSSLIDDPACVRMQRPHRKENGARSSASFMSSPMSLKKGCTAGVDTGVSQDGRLHPA